MLMNNTHVTPKSTLSQQGVPFFLGCQLSDKIKGFFLHALVHQENT